VNGSEGSAARALLLQRLAVLSTHWLWQNPALNCIIGDMFAPNNASTTHLSDEHHMATAELLLQLADQSLVNLLIVAELRHWDVDHDALFGRSEVELL